MTLSDDLAARAVFSDRDGMGSDMARRRLSSS